MAARQRLSNVGWIAGAALMLLTLTLCGLAVGRQPAAKGSTPVKPSQEPVAAPEFPRGLAWLNTDRPIQLAQLKGKIVLLDFWTYCCINCMHVLPELAKLEAKYPNELVVIGVHSAKFTGEKVTENIRQAILRYEIAHPVVNDRDMKIWRSYGARAWPTLMLIGPDGNLLGSHSGEGVFAPFDRAIAEAVERFDKSGQLDRTPMTFALEGASVGRSLLSFPGKVLATDQQAGEEGRLFIADSNHNRIVVVSLADRSVRAVVGSGRAGLADGPFESATFNKPQGMAIDGDILYVADTENHALRAVDLRTRRVTTIAGTGRQGGWGAGGGKGEQTELNSPWDLVRIDRVLYVAMAGTHQLWRMDLDTGVIGPYAGSGREARVDGPLMSAALAQPSGLTTDGRKLYFADSEVSAIRSADLDLPTGQAGLTGRVETVVGGDLFDYGDRDGVGLEARLQHPLGVAFHDGVLYAADTYNNKLKRIDLKTGRIETFLGSGRAGLDDGDDASAVTFDEPGGLSAAGGKLYVADTNNHAVRVVDLAGGSVSTLAVANPDALLARPAAEGAFDGQAITFDARTVKSGDVTVVIDLPLPQGLKLNADAPSSMTVSSSQEAALAVEADAASRSGRLSFPVTVPVRAAAGEATLTVDLDIYYCTEGRESLCYFKALRLVLPVTVDESTGDDKIAITAKADLPTGL